MQWDEQHGVMKTIASVQYPIQLPMAKFCTKRALDDGWGSTYNLGGVVLHYGSSGNGGHYVFIQRRPSGSWALFNDAQEPLPLSPSQVLGYHQLVCGLVYHRTPSHR